jgi:hypothetical protein
MLPQKQQLSLLEVWQRYETAVLATQPQPKATALLAQTRTALLRYTLPGWGFPPPKGQRLTAQEATQGLQCLSQVSVAHLQEAAALQEDLFEQLHVAGNSRRNYRWALHQFLDWCQQQSWFDTNTWSEAEQPTPRKREKKGSATDVRVTTRKASQAYRLPDAALSASLQQELADLEQYLTDSKPSERSQRRTSATIQQTLNQVRRILGWLHHVEGIAQDALSLHLLVPETWGQSQQRQLLEPEGTKNSVELVQAYLQWQQASRAETAALVNPPPLSPHTVIKTVNTWLQVVSLSQQQALEQSESLTESLGEATVALHELRQTAVAALKTHQTCQ